MQKRRSKKKALPRGKGGGMGKKWKSPPFPATPLAPLSRKKEEESGKKEEMRKGRKKEKGGITYLLITNYNPGALYRRKKGRRGEKELMEEKFKSICPSPRNYFGGKKKKKRRGGGGKK